MLFLVFGSSAAGKTTLVAALRERVARLEVHDFDEIGVPPGATRSWRHGANERWIDRALTLQEAGTDLLLAGQTPPGEFLASPSAAALEAICACLLDCSDEVRAARLKARGPDWLERAGGSLDDYLAWGRWMRGHATDPRYEQHVIRQDGDGLAWERVDSASQWRVEIVDASGESQAMIAAVKAWIGEERARFH